jgi:hypothetical protein
VIFFFLFSESKVLAGSSFIIEKSNQNNFSSLQLMMGVGSLLSDITIPLD